MTTHYTIFFSCSWWNRPTDIFAGLPGLPQYFFYNIDDPVFAYIYRPRKIRHSVVDNGFALMTPRLPQMRGQHKRQKTYLVSIANPPMAQEDKIPLQVPIAMGSAV
jgi:5-keto 4-deoxyuronate isomerase